MVLLKLLADIQESSGKVIWNMGHRNFIKWKSLKVQLYTYSMKTTTVTKVNILNLVNQRMTLSIIWFYHYERTRVDNI